MTDKPTTATAVMMESYEERRLEARDRAIAASVAVQMVERYFNPDAIEGMNDVRQQITRAAEHAAYEAIKKEREMHAGDMKALKAWADVKWAETMLQPKSIVVPAQGIVTEGGGAPAAPVSEAN